MKKKVAVFSELSRGRRLVTILRVNTISLPLDCELHFPNVAAFSVWAAFILGGAEKCIG